MADTVKTKSQLLARFVANLLGDIKAQDARDFIVSIFGWASISDPTSDNDSVDTAGIGAYFSQGSKWINYAADRVYICTLEAPGNATWLLINDGGVPTSRNINTTAPLTGGGNLSADRTLGITDFIASGVGHARGAVPDPGAVSGTAKYLREDATWQTPPGTGVATSRAINTTAPLTGGGDLSADRTLAVSDFVASGGSHARGAVPDPGAVSGTTKFLREDASWQVPPGTGVASSRAINTTAPLTGGGDLSADRTIAISDFVASGGSHARGAVPDPGSTAGTTKFLREDATWTEPYLSNSVRCTNSGAQSVTTGAGQALTFDAETWDNGGLHSTSSNTSRLTAVVAGKYLVTGSASFAANGTGQRGLDFVKNGTTNYGGMSIPVNSGTLVTKLCITGLVNLAATDYVELFANQTSGGNLNVTVQSFGMFLMDS